MKLLHKFMAATLAVSLLAGCSSEPKKEGPPSNVIKLRNDGFEENTKNVLLFFCGKFEFFC